MNRFKTTLLFIISLVGFSFVATNVAAADIVETTILQTFQKHNRKFVCLNTPASIPVMRKEVEKYLPLKGLKVPTADDVARAAYTAYPCPFSPYRSEVKPATKKDILGVWLYPETSQQLRYGPASTLWARHRALPIKCESVAYYKDGDTRNAQIVGKADCAISRAKDMDIARANPKVSSWAMIGKGRVKISRTDVEDHIEEWEIFKVVKPFTMLKVKFNKGDLLAYLRKEKGNDYNVATMFRHLQRLP